MKHCALCGWSGPDAATVCPNAATHRQPSLAVDVSAQGRFQAVVGGHVDGLRGPVRHFLSDKVDVYQNAAGQYVDATGRVLPGRRKGLR